MKRFIALLLALSLTSCASLNKSFFEGGTSLIATVQNPVTTDQQAAVEASYNVVGSGALAYSRWRRCKPGEGTTVTNLCSKWSVVQKFKYYDGIIFKQLADLRSFMDANDQVSAIAVYNALVTSLRDFRALAFINGAIN